MQTAQVQRGILWRSIVSLMCRMVSLASYWRTSFSVMHRWHMSFLTHPLVRCAYFAFFLQDAQDQRGTPSGLYLSFCRSLLPTSTGARRMSAFPTDVSAGNGWGPWQETRLAYVTPCTRRTLTVLISPHEQPSVLLHYYNEGASWKTPFTASASVGVLG